MVEHWNELDFDFDYNFGESDRSQLLDEAAQTVRALKTNLGSTTSPSDSPEDPALSLLAQLGQETAEFGAYPQVVRMREKNFTEAGMNVPHQFRELSKTNKFYWLHFPINLFPLQNLPFYKLECGVEFNREVVHGHLRPRAQLILPDRKFLEILRLEDSVELRIGEDFEFTADSGSLEGQVGMAKAKGKAAVDVKAAGKLGLVAGPFTYRLKRAQIERSEVNNEKVRWRVAGAEFFQEEYPAFIVVLQVPKAVIEVKIEAALQAYHKPNLASMGLGEVIKYFGSGLATFFRAGAPAKATKVWDITPSL